MLLDLRSQYESRGATTNRLGTPLDIPSGTIPLYYFDPSKTSTQTLSANGSIASRSDLSGNNVTASCPEDSNRPQPVSNGIGGLNSVGYYGGSQYDQAVINFTGVALTAFVVIQPQNASGYSRFMSMGGQGAGDYNSTQGFDVEQNNGGSSIYLQHYSIQSSQYAFTNNAPLLVEVVFDGSNGYLYVSGNLIGSIGNAQTFVLDHSTFGRSIQGSDGFAGLQGSQMLYGSALNTADRQWDEGCLAWQWDGGTAGVLVGQLPANHPYKNAPPMVTVAGVTRRRSILITAS